MSEQTQNILATIMCSAFVLQFVLIMVLGLVYKRREKHSHGTISAVSVIIPFRDERERIAALLESINQLQIPAAVEVEFIFVDDRSVDNTAAFIEKKLKTQFKIVSNSASGKKAAIRTAIEVAEHEYILTWDADISVSSDYFKSLSQLPSADMWILPVKMKGRSLVAKLATVEFDWMQMLTNVMAKWQTPILCNGANLLFKKEKYQRALEIRKDDQIQSGDDLFLLQALNKMHADIRVTRQQALSISTYAPDTWNELLLQRKRWSGKMTKLMSAVNGVLFFVLGFFTFLAFGAIYFAFVYMNPIFLLPLLLKFFNEFVFLRFYRELKESASDLLIVLLHVLWYPLFLLVILFPISKREDDRWSV